MTTDFCQSSTQSSSSSLSANEQSLLVLLNSDSHLVASICDVVARRDTQVRQSYLKAFTQSLSSTNESNSGSSLAELITMFDDRGELPVVMALVEVVRADQLQDLARLLTYLFDAKNLLSQLVINVLIRELSLSPNETVLRSSSLVSSILSYSFQTFGSYYIAETVGPIVKRLLDSKGAVSNYEVHPDFLKSGANIEENQQNLCNLAFEVLNAFTLNREKFPVKLRTLCRCVYEVLPERFPQNDILRFIGGTLIFLRFINPFLTSLSEFNIICDGPLSDKVQRVFTLVAKLLQSAANEQPLREECMKPLNKTILLLRNDIKEFVNYLIKRDEKVII